MSIKPLIESTRSVQTILGIFEMDGSSMVKGPWDNNTGLWAMKEDQQPNIKSVEWRNGLVVVTMGIKSGDKEYYHLADKAYSGDEVVRKYYQIAKHSVGRAYQWLKLNTTETKL
jgi:hypothetical protein